VRANSGAASIQVEGAWLARDPRSGWPRYGVRLTKVVMGRSNYAPESRNRADMRVGARGTSLVPAHKMKHLVLGVVGPSADCTAPGKSAVERR